MVTMNSAFDSILPSLACGAIAKSAMKNRKATTCSALNSMTLNGSNDSSRGYRLKSSIIVALQHRHHLRLGEPYCVREYARGCGIEHVILDFQKDRAD